MLFLNEEEVRSLLPMREAIPLVRGAFVDYAQGKASNHPRRRLRMSSGSMLHAMEAACRGYFGAKIYATHPESGARFLLILYRERDAAPLVLMEAGWLGQIRTGAASGVATDALARRDAATVGVIGSGFQARSQVEAVAAVRPLRFVRVWSRKPERLQQFAAECAEALGIDVRPALSAREAVEGADIVVTATYAKDPVVEAAWIAPGTHINAIGSNQPRRRELPADLIARADLIAVDSLEDARLESGDLLLALDEQGWTSPKLVELGKILGGGASGRGGRNEITLFKSNGLALEDVAAGGYVYERALQAGVGRQIPLFHS